MTRRKKNKISSLIDAFDKPAAAKMGENGQEDRVHQNRALIEEMFPDIELTDEFMDEWKDESVERAIEHIISHASEFATKKKRDDDVVDLDETQELDPAPPDCELIECLICTQEFPKARGFECVPICANTFHQEKKAALLVASTLCAFFIPFPLGKLFCLLIFATYKVINFFFPSMLRCFNPRRAISTADSIHISTCFYYLNYYRFIKNDLPHTFCVDCVRGHSLASLAGAPSVAKNAQGLNCMAEKCGNTIVFSSFARFLSRKNRRNLSELLDNYALLSVADKLKLEHCNRCAFSMCVEVAPEVNKVFECLKCGYAYCRMCDAPWSEHFGKRCSEMPGGKHEYETKLNEAVVRICPHCKLQFIKEANCNMMHCRCGTNMCYICRQTDINYDHFCRHALDPGKGCTECERCLQWEDFRPRDIKELERVKSEYNAAKGAKKLEKSAKNRIENAGGRGARCVLM